MKISSQDFKVVSVAQDSDLLSKTSERISAEWPEFMLHDPVAVLLSDCYKKLPDYQFVLVDKQTDTVVAIANSIPLCWPYPPEDLSDDGWDWALATGLKDLGDGRIPNILCALQVVVFGENRGRSISSHVLKAMKLIGESSGLSGLIAPVRPNRKCEYPRVSMSEYITKTDGEGRFFDPWLRVHHSLGARIIKPCPTSMRITGTVDEWEKWTRMKFPQAGDYVVPGALVPVEINVEKNSGVYIEPNVWMYHPPASKS